jgi:hypothetical protein
MPSLFEARCRLPTSATETRRASNQTRALRILAGTEASTSFLVFVPRPLPCGSGDTRRAALRPLVRPQCWFLPLAWVCPTVIPNRTPHHETLWTLRVWCMRKTRTGRRTERRTRLPYASDDYSCVRGCMRLGRMRDDVPLLGALRTSAVIGAPPATGGYPRQSTDRPRPCFRRRPAKDAAFHPTRMPFTVTTREGATRREGSLRPSRRLSRSRRPHALPRDGVLGWALQGHGAVTRLP